MREHILGKGVDEETDDLLILRDPGIILRVGDRDLFLVLIFSFNEFRRAAIGSLKETHDPGTAKGGEHLCLPIHEIVTIKLDDGRRADGGRGRWC